MYVQYTGRDMRTAIPNPLLIVLKFAQSILLLLFAEITFLAQIATIPILFDIMKVIVINFISFVYVYLNENISNKKIMYLLRFKRLC